MLAGDVPALGFYQNPSYQVQASVPASSSHWPVSSQFIHLLCLYKLKERPSCVPSFPSTRSPSISAFAMARAVVWTALSNDRAALFSFLSFFRRRWGGAVGLGSREEGVMEPAAGWGRGGVGARKGTACAHLASTPLPSPRLLASNSVDRWTDGWKALRNSTKPARCLPAYGPPAHLAHPAALMALWPAAPYAAQLAASPALPCCTAGRWKGSDQAIPMSAVYSTAWLTSFDGGKHWWRPGNAWERLRGGSKRGLVSQQGLKLRLPATRPDPSLGPAPALPPRRGKTAILPCYGQNPPGVRVAAVPPPGLTWR